MRRWIVALTAALLVTGCTSTPDPSPSVFPSSAGPDLNAEIVKVAKPAPIGLAVAGGLVWVAGSSSGDISGIDTAQAMITKSINVGKTPLRVTGRDHVVYVSVFGDGKVQAFDSESRAMLHVYPMSGGPEGLATTLDYLWVARQDASLVTQIPIGKSPKRDVPLPNKPRLVDVTSAYAFVSSYEAGTITRIEQEGDEVVTSEKICEGAQGIQALGEVVWVTCTRGNEVVAVDQKTLKVVGRVAVPGQPDGLWLGAERIYVAATDGPTLYQISNVPTAPTIIFSKRLGNAAPLNDRANVDVIGFGGRIWVSSFREDVVYGLRLPRD